MGWVIFLLRLPSVSIFATKACRACCIVHTFSHAPHTQPPKMPEIPRELDLKNKRRAFSGGGVRMWGRFLRAVCLRVRKRKRKRKRKEREVTRHTTAKRESKNEGRIMKVGCFFLKKPTLLLPCFYFLFFFIFSVGISSLMACVGRGGFSFGKDFSFCPTLFKPSSSSFVFSPPFCLPSFLPPSPLCVGWWFRRLILSGYVHKSVQPTEGAGIKG